MQRRDYNAENLAGDIFSQDKYLLLWWCSLVSAFIAMEPEREGRLGSSALWPCIQQKARGGKSWYGCQKRPQEKQACALPKVPLGCGKKSRPR